MISNLFVSNLLAWALQVLCLALVAAALPALLRLDAPGVRYAYWRLLLGLSLVLPLVQPWHAVKAVTSIAASSRLAGPGDGGTEESVTTSVLTADSGWMLVLFAVLAAGAFARVAWIAFGLLRLRRLRRAGEGAILDDQEEVQRLIGARAELRYVPGIKQPVTFGIRPAVVLLPETLRVQSTDVQRAVLAHELFHVQRHDWAWLLVEELVRAVFWFHPAVWWLVSRIQLTREEVVDEMALLVARRRSTYVEALLAFADTPPFTPVAAFARRRHLFRRIALISKEAAMSSKRLIISCAVMATIVAAGGWYAVSAFPLQQVSGAVAGPQGGDQAGPLESRAKPITPENPIPRRVSSTPADYPPEATALALRGSVTLRITLDELGRIAEARAIGVSFHIPNQSGPVTLSFNNPSQSDMERFVLKAPAGGNQDPAAWNAALKALIMSARDAVLTWRYDPPFEAPLAFNVTTNFSPQGTAGAGGVVTPMSAPPPPPPPPARNVPGGAVSKRPGPPPPPPPPAPEFEAAALRVGGIIAPPKKIRDVKPIYPEDAKAEAAQGVVIIEIRIDEEGYVSNARVLRSIPPLDQAALDAVRQWVFTPTLLNGKPVPLIMTVTVNFTLQ